MKVSHVIGVLIAVTVIAVMSWMIRSMNKPDTSTPLSAIGIRIGVACGGLISILLLYLNNLLTTASP
jgi:hypothetical protein